MDKSIIVLVGTTGSGKSTLGNLLVDPERIKDPNQQEIFLTKDSGDPCTNGPQLEKIRNDTNIIVMDTPGFNESKTQDIKHALSVLKVIKDEGKIRAVIYVHSKRTGDHFRKLLKYIHTLFTEKVLNKNLIIAYTGISNSQYDIMRRRTNGENIGKVLEKTQENVKDLLGMDHIVPIYDIDSCPRGGKDEWDVTMSKRKTILDAVARMDLVGVSELSFAKPDDLYNSDIMKSKELEAQQMVKYEKLKGVNEKENAYLEKMQYITRDISRYEIRIKDYERELVEKDSSQLVITGSASQYRDFGGKVNIAVHTGYSIAKHDIDLRDEDDVVVKEDYTPDHHGIEVEIGPSTPVIGRTGGTVTCYAEKRVKYAVDIQNTKASLHDITSFVASKKSDIDDITAHSSYLKEHYTVELQNEIDNITQERAELENPYMDFDKAYTLYSGPHAN